MRSGGQNRGAHRLDDCAGHSPVLRARPLSRTITDARRGDRLEEMCHESLWWTPHVDLGASLVAGALVGCDAPSMIDPVRRERLGSALHALAGELVAERRRIAELERENARLKQRVEMLERQLVITAGEPCNDEEEQESDPSCLSERSG